MVNLAINESRIKPVAEHFWAKRYDLTRDDLDTIDGTFLRECCGPSFAYLDPVMEAMDQGDPDFDVPVRECQLSGLVEATVVVPGRLRTKTERDITLGVQVPVVTVASASVQNREWNGRRVELEMRRRFPSLAENYPFGKGRVSFRFPEGCVQPPFLQLLVPPESLDGHELHPSPTALIKVAISAHSTPDGFPPEGVVAASYDAVTSKTGWRYRLREARVQNQEPHAAVRGWAISLMKMATGQTASKTVGWFASEFPMALSDSEKSFYEARNNVVERIPEVSFLKKDTPSKKRG